jgi:6-phosphogluconate dehydrogenase
MAENNQNQLGLVGLGTMGAALAEALARADFEVMAYDPVAAEPIAGVTLHDTLADMIASLTPPRRVLMMVTAGDPVDSVIDALSPKLAVGDVLIDGGNSHFRDTERRSDALAAKGLHFIGTGISGGEEGARHGASIMAGGSEAGYGLACDILKAIAAREGDAICATHIGPGGAGHFVKMVHNGIEYALMQAIGEVWLMLDQGCGMSAVDIAAQFRRWNDGPLQSFLMEITADVLEATEPGSAGPLIDVIDDAAAQTGTGQWCVAEAMVLGVAVPSIAAAVAARSLSGMADVRTMLQRQGAAEIAPMIDGLGDALLGSFLSAYAQGFSIIHAASHQYGWSIDCRAVARIWRRGCIIQGALLDPIGTAFRTRPDLSCLLMDDAINDMMTEALPGWRQSVVSAMEAALPVPVLAASLTWRDALATPRLWTALIQGQRDLFGAHGLRRTGREGTFHGNWPDRRDS